jgi:hypothetical protein
MTSDERVFAAFWDELCPAIRCTPNDKALYLPALRAALAAAGPDVPKEVVEALRKIHTWAHHTNTDDGGLETLIEALVLIEVEARTALSSCGEKP